MLQPHVPLETPVRRAFGSSPASSLLIGVQRRELAEIISRILCHIQEHGVFHLLTGGLPLLPCVIKLRIMTLQKDKRLSGLLGPG